MESREMKVGEKTESRKIHIYLCVCVCVSFPVSISFENYRMVHPYEDSDSSEDEVDWQDTRHDPYKAGALVCATHKIIFLYILSSEFYFFYLTAFDLLIQTNQQRSLKRDLLGKARTSPQNMTRKSVDGRTRHAWTM